MLRYFGLEEAMRMNKCMNWKEHTYLAYDCTASEALKESIPFRIMARLGVSCSKALARILKVKL